jgi:hypothetical protein
LCRAWSNASAGAASSRVAPSIQWRLRRVPRLALPGAASKMEQGRANRCLAGLPLPLGQLSTSLPTDRRTSPHYYCMGGHDSPHHFLIAHPDSTQDEMAAFVYNEGCALYSKQRISKISTTLRSSRRRSLSRPFTLLVQRSSFGCSPTGTAPLLLGSSRSANGSSSTLISLG